MNRIVFNLSFPSNTILSCFFYFFFTIHLYFLISAVIAQISIPTAEIVIPTGIATNEANAEIERKPVTVETKISKVCNIILNTYMSLHIFHS